MVLQEITRMNEEMSKKHVVRRDDSEANSASLKLAREERESARQALLVERDRAERERMESDRRTKEAVMLRTELDLKLKTISSNNDLISKLQADLKMSEGGRAEAEGQLAHKEQILDALRRELDDLKKKSAEKDAMTADAMKRAAEFEKTCEYLRMEAKKSSDLLSVKTLDFDKLLKEKDSEFLQREKMMQRVKELESELIARKNKGEGLSAEDKRRYEDEIAMLNKKIKEMMEFQDNFEREKSSVSMENMNRLKAKEAEVIELRRRIKELEDSLSTVRIELKTQSDANVKLRGDSEALNRRIKQLEEKLEETNKRYAESQKTVSIITLERDDLNATIIKLKKTIEELRAQLENVKNDASAKVALENLKKEHARQMMAILGSLTTTRQVEAEFLEKFAQEYFSTMNCSNDQTRINKTKEEDLCQLILEMLRELKTDIEGQHAEIQQIVQININLSKEVNKISEEKRELDVKLNDLQHRYNQKIDLVGKLTVKVLILMTEIDRCSNYPPH